MGFLKNFITPVFIGIATLGTALSPVNAAIFTYEYTGQNYNLFLSSPYDNSMTITGSFSFDLATSLNLDFGSHLADITAFTIFDGVQTYDNSNSNFNLLFFSTDASGGIATWRMQWEIDGSGSPLAGIRSFNGCYDYVVLQTTTACSVNGAGAFTGPSAVPVPAAIWLFGTALIGLVGFSKRRKTV